MNLEGFERCFLSDFDTWLWNSNHHIFKRLKKDAQLLLIDISKWDEWRESQKEYKTQSMSEILNVLIRYPEADYFWYSYNGVLTWSLPTDEEVHADSIRINKSEFRRFIRNWNIDIILGYEIDKDSIE